MVKSERLAAMRRDWAASRDSIAARHTGPFTVSQSGRPVVLFHGFLGHPVDFGPLADSAKDEGFTVVAPQYGVAASAEDLTVLLCDLVEDFGEPAHVVGHSLGGVVAARAAARCPELFVSVTTIASPLAGAPLAVLPLARHSTLTAVRPKASEVRDLSCPAVPLMSVAAEFDALVPVRSALSLVPEGPSLLVPEGHMSVLRNADVLAAVSLFRRSVEASLV